MPFFFLFWIPMFKAKPSPGVTPGMTFADTDGGVDGPPIQRHLAGNSSTGMQVTHKNTLADNNWIMFKHFCLRTTKNAFADGFYSLAESGAPASSPQPRNATCSSTACAPALGRTRSHGEPKNHAELCKEILKGYIKKSVEQERSFVAFTSLKTNVNLLCKNSLCLSESFVE